MYSCFFRYYGKYLVYFLCLFTILSTTHAQNINYDFSPLSSTKYLEKIKQLEKYKVPKVYSDKSAQAWYDEFLTNNNQSLLSLFKDDDVLYDTLLLNKCNSIFKKIATANPNYNFDTIKLYINRSIVANAACYGEGTIMINLGLFLWIDNDDELALVIAHEMSHQFLNHSEGQMKKTIETLTSDDFKRELKSIKKADYGRYGRFKKLMDGIKIESGKHSRYKESEADSLGVLLCKNAKYDINNAAMVMLKLDYVDDIFTSNKLYNLREFINGAAIDLSYFTAKPKYNGLSGVNVTMNANKDIDSIKTHPDCKKRYESIMGKNANISPQCCTFLSRSHSAFKEKAMLEIVRYLYETNSMTLCIHLSFFALKNNYNAAFYKNMLSSCFSKIYYNDINLKRFNSVNEKAERGSNLKELQDYLFAVSTKDLEVLATNFLNSNENTNAVDYAFADLMYQTQIKKKDAISAYNIFTAKYPNNKYTYLIQKK